MSDVSRIIDQEVHYTPWDTVWFGLKCEVGAAVGTNIDWHIESEILLLYGYK